jgi:hypothetical protein
VLLYLLTRQWDEETGTNFHGAMERHLRSAHPSMTEEDIALVLSRIRIVTKVQHVRTRAPREKGGSTPP